MEQNILTCRLCGSLPTFYLDDDGMWTVKCANKYCDGNQSAKLYSYDEAVDYWNYIQRRKFEVM